MAKASTGKRPAAKSVSTRKTASPRKTVPIPYQHAADYKHLVSTGSLVRAERKAIVITHYIEEMIPTRQVARLQSGSKEDPPTYILDDIEEEPRRLIVAAVRLDPEHALSLAAIIAEKVHSIRPDLIPVPDAETQDLEEKK
jgi:hypothetical protein